MRKLDKLVIEIIKSIPTKSTITFKRLENIIKRPGVRIVPIIIRNIEEISDCFHRVIRADGDHPKTYPDNIMKMAIKNSRIEFGDDYNLLDYRLDFKGYINFDDIKKSALTDKSIVLALEKYLNDTNNKELKSKLISEEFFSANDKRKHKIIQDIRKAIKSVIKNEIRQNVIDIPKDLVEEKVRKIGIVTELEEIAMISIVINLIDSLRSEENGISYSNTVYDLEEAEMYKDYTSNYRDFNSKKRDMFLSNRFEYSIYFDIKDFYPNCRRISKYFDSVIFKPYLQKGDSSWLLVFLDNFSTDGLIQGAVISGFLSELILNRFDYVLKARYDSAEVIRYADDYYVFSKKKYEIIDIEELLILEYEKYFKFEINYEKSRVSNITNQIREYYYRVNDFDIVNSLYSTYSDFDYENLLMANKVLSDFNKTLLDDEMQDILLTTNFMDDESKERHAIKSRILSSADYESLRTLINELIEEKKLFNCQFSNYMGYIFSYSKNKNISYSNYIRILRPIISDIKGLKKEEKFYNYYMRIYMYYVFTYNTTNNKCINNKQRIEYKILRLKKDMEKLLKAYKEEKKVFGIYSRIYVYDITSNSQYLLRHKSNSFHLSRDNKLLEKITKNLKVLFSLCDEICIDSPYLYEYRVIKYLEKSNDFEEAISGVLKIISESEEKFNYIEVDKSFLQISDFISSNVKSKNRFDKIIFLHHFVKDIWQNGAKDLPFYTLHNELHSVELIKMLDDFDKSLLGLLIKKLLSEEDIYVYICASYTHDLGMLYFNYNDYYSDKKNQSKIRLDGVKYNRANEIDYRPDYVKVNSNVKYIYDLHSKSRESYTRDNHAFYSSKFKKLIMDKYPRFYLDDIFDVGANHYRNREDMIVEVKSDESDFDKELVSILLRMMDSFDQSIKRVSYNMFDFLYEIENIDGYSLSHWAKHILVKEVSFKSDGAKKSKIEYVFNSLGELMNKRINSDKVTEYYRYVQSTNDLLIGIPGKVETMFDRFLYDYFRYSFQSVFEFLEYINKAKVGLSVEMSINDLKSPHFENYLNVIYDLYK